MINRTGRHLIVIGRGYQVLDRKALEISTSIHAARILVPAPKGVKRRVRAARGAMHNSGLPDMRALLKIISVKALGTAARSQGGGLARSRLALAEPEDDLWHC